jgi:hypothetical protein
MVGVDYLAEVLPFMTICQKIDVLHKLFPPFMHGAKMIGQVRTTAQTRARARDAGAGAACTEAGSSVVVAPRAGIVRARAGSAQVRLAPLRRTRSPFPSARLSAHTIRPAPLALCPRR